MMMSSQSRLMAFGVALHALLIYAMFDVHSSRHWCTTWSPPRRVSERRHRVLSSSSPMDYEVIDCSSSRNPIQKILEPSEASLARRSCTP